MTPEPTDAEPLRKGPIEHLTYDQDPDVDHCAKCIVGSVYGPHNVNNPAIATNEVRWEAVRDARITLRAIDFWQRRQDFVDMTGSLQRANAERDSLRARITELEQDVEGWKRECHRKEGEIIALEEQVADLRMRENR